MRRRLRIAKQIGGWYHSLESLLLPTDPSRFVSDLTFSAGYFLNDGWSRNTMMPPYTALQQFA